MTKTKKTSTKQSEYSARIYTAAEAREEYNNGGIKDRVIVSLSYPNDHVPMIGFGAFLRGEFFVRQAELPSDDAVAEALGQKQFDDLAAFLKTLQDPEDVKTA